MDYLKKAQEQSYTVPKLITELLDAASKTLHTTSLNS